MATVDRLGAEGTPQRLRPQRCGRCPVRSALANGSPPTAPATSATPNSSPSCSALGSKPARTSSRSRLACCPGSTAFEASARPPTQSSAPKSGLSEAKACQILASMELGRRYVSLAPEERSRGQLPRGRWSTCCRRRCRPWIRSTYASLLLNTRNEVMGIEEIYIGNVNSSVVRPAEVFRPAIRGNATSILAVHNHPSGDPTPSGADVSITRDLVEAGNLLGLDLLDHLVIGSGQRYVSMKEARLGFA